MPYSPYDRSAAPRWSIYECEAPSCRLSWLRTPEADWGKGARFKSVRINQGLLALGNVISALGEQETAAAAQRGEGKGSKACALPGE